MTCAIDEVDAYGDVQSFILADQQIALFSISFRDTHISVHRRAFPSVTGEFIYEKPIRSASDSHFIPSDTEKIKFLSEIFQGNL